MTRMIRILIADDHKIVREGVKRLLVDESDFSVVVEASNASEVIAGIRSEPIDVAILDLTMPGRDGFEMIAHVKALQPKLPILVFTMHAHESYALRALRAGADGYLTKDNAVEQLIAAVRRLASGGQYVCAGIAERLALHFGQRDSVDLLHTKLSNREYKVFELLVDGKACSQIAKDLSLSIKTVSTHKARLLQKMNMTNQAELIRYAIAQNLVFGWELKGLSETAATSLSDEQSDDTLSELADERQSSGLMQHGASATPARSARNQGFE
jgi:DNA-binding NarL/FixJ family response regulator